MESWWDRGMSPLFLWAIDSPLQQIPRTMPHKDILERKQSDMLVIYESLIGIELGSEWLVVL